MVDMEETTTQRIGKIDMSVRFVETNEDPAVAHQRRIEALVRLLMVEWQRLHGGGTNG